MSVLSHFSGAAAEANGRQEAVVQPPHLSTEENGQPLRSTKIRGVHSCSTTRTRKQKSISPSCGRDY